MSSSSIVVIGSCFIDNIAYVPRLPNPGETLHSQSYLKSFGGKGANQAVMSALLGSKTFMVSALGDDYEAQSYLDELKKYNVDISFMQKIKNEHTGTTLINVNCETGENQIVICPNAEYKLTPENIPFDKLFTKSCQVFVCQNEIPLPTTLTAIKTAYLTSKNWDNPIYIIFNCAPAPTNLQDKEKIIPFLKYVSLFCPNETEATLFTGIEVNNVDSAKEACSKFHQMGVKDVVITLGGKGFVFSSKGKQTYCPGIKVKKVVDTTGAGDCFVGTVAHYILKGDGVEEACRKANKIAAMSVMKKGTQSSYPSLKEIEASHL